MQPASAMPQGWLAFSIGGSMREAWVRSLGPEDPLEKGMGTHSSILACESHGQSSLVGYYPWDHKELDSTEQLTHAQFEIWMFRLSVSKITTLPHGDSGGSLRSLKMGLCYRTEWWLR